MLTKSEAYLWVTHLLQAESDAIYYAWPPASQEELERAAELRDGADAFYEAAVRGVPDQLVLDIDGVEPDSERAKLWRRSLDLWDGKAE